jgi:nucleoside-diphosphate-sugar epimerase
MSGVLIFGATGFLGSHLLQHFEQEAYLGPVTCVTRGAPPADIGRADGAAWLHADLVEAGALDLAELLAEVRPSAVVNCIGCIRGSAEEFFAVNVRFVEHLVQAVEATKTAMLVHLGSAAEYGLQPAGTAITEAALPRPIGDYGRSKLQGTTIIANAVDQGAIAAKVLRVFNPLGARSPQSSVAGMVARALWQAQRANDPVLNVGDLSDFRDFIDARDVASAVGCCLVAPSVGSTVLNVGRGEAVQVRALIARLAMLAGFSGEIQEMAQQPPTGPVVRWQAASISRIGAQMGWTPRYSIDDAALALWESIEARERALS